MAGKLGTGGGPMADINVTPLIDVVLVLLVVFMVITPLLQSGLPVSLPEATQTTTVNDAGQHIVVSIGVNEDCKEYPCDLPAMWYVEQDSVDAISLLDAINMEYQKNPSRSILIKADHRLLYKQMREVTDILGEQNMTTVLIAAAKEE
jgi:biopolymer transport protein TolR